MSGKEWRILALLAASAFLNYFDRANLSAGATNIQRDLGFTNYQLGLLLSAFFWTYAACQLLGVSGWLDSRPRLFSVVRRYGHHWRGARVRGGVRAAAAALARLIGMATGCGGGSSSSSSATDVAKGSYILTLEGSDTSDSGITSSTALTLMVD
jgi:MFS family permease